MRRPLRYLSITAAVGVAAVGAIGLLHLPVFRPLLARAGVSCPADKVTLEQVAAVRGPALEGFRGRDAASTRARFGWTIGETRQADVETWSRAQHIACAPVVRGLRYLSCANVPAAALGESPADPAVTDVTLTFGRDGVLEGIDLLASGLTAAQAMSVGSHRADELRQEFGAPLKNGGDFTDAFLSAAAFRTAYLRYQFADLLVQVSAVNIPTRGMVVHEQYVGIPGETAAH